MKKAYLSFGAVLASGFLMAQSLTNSTEYSFQGAQKYPAKGITTIETKVVKNQDRMEYYSENFDTDFGGWTVNTEVGNVDFKLTSTGHFNNPNNTFQIPDLLTSTPTQWVIVDSDGDGTSYNDPERTSLTSPVIDLTAAGAPANVKLEFEQFFAEWGGNITDDTEDSCFVGVSTNGGASWDEVEINALVGREDRPNPEIFQVNISDWVANDPSNVQIRFRWAGAWNYGWQIDNVTIVDLENNELSATRAYRRNVKNPNAQPVQYAQVPLAQVHEVSMGCVVKNLGYNPITNVGVNWRILDGSGTAIGNGTTSTENIATLGAGPLGESDTVWFSTGWTPSATGDYTFEMVVVSDSTDEDMMNDTVTIPYRVTDYLYAREMGPLDGSIQNFASNNSAGFKMGCYYEIFADDVLKAINVTIDTATIGDICFVELRKYNETSQEWDYVTQSVDHTIQASDLGNEIILELGASEQVTAGDLYLPLFGHYGGENAPSLGSSGSAHDGVIGYGENVNNGAATGLADPSTPMVRLNFDGTIAVEDEAELVDFTIYPNPTDNELNILFNAETKGKSVITVRDLAGKVLSVDNVSAVAKTSINTSNLASGVYFLEISNDGKTSTTKFTKK